jgi:hypothetical protein
MQLEELSPAAWQQFASWFPNPPPYPKLAVFISEDGVVLAGAIYEESDEAVLFRSFVVNQAVPLERRNKAAKFLQQVCESLCKCRGKVGLMVGGVPQGWEPRQCGFLPKRPFQPAQQQTKAEAPKTTPAPPPEEDDFEVDDENAEVIGPAPKPKPVGQARSMRKRAAAKAAE